MVDSKSHRPFEILSLPKGRRNRVPGRRLEVNLQIIWRQSRIVSSRQAWATSFQFFWSAWATWVHVSKQTSKQRVKYEINIKNLRLELSKRYKMDSDFRTITSSLNSLPASSQFPAQSLPQKSLRQLLLPVFSIPAAPNYTNCSSLPAQLGFSWLHCL